MPSVSRVAARYLNQKIAKRQNDAALAKAIQKVLDSIRDMDGHGPGNKYDPVADTGIWVGKDEVRRFNNRSGADVVLHFDGAGYDYLSTYAEYPQVADKYRAMIERAAKALGYMMEDQNNWSIGFYFED